MQHLERIQKYLSDWASHRHRRSVKQIGGDWPAKSRENWIEVLVVVDGPMVKYHGSKVRHYVLTLMRMVRRQLQVLTVEIYLVINPRWTSSTETSQLVTSFESLWSNSLSSKIASLPPAGLEVLGQCLHQTC